MYCLGLNYAHAVRIINLHTLTKPLENNMRARAQRIINVLRKSQGSYGAVVAILEDPVMRAAFGFQAGDQDVEAALDYARPLVLRDNRPNEELSFYLNGEPYCLPVLRLVEDFERAASTPVIDWDNASYFLLKNALGEPFGVYPR